MTDPPIVTQLSLWPPSAWPPKTPENKPNLHTYWHHPERWPSGVADSLTAQRNLELLGPLHWADVPERDLHRWWGLAPAARPTRPPHGHF